MTYSVGGKIEAADYNTLAGNANALWSSGSGSTGYGQSQLTPTVAVGTRVLAAQWSALVTAINNMGRHQDAAYSPVPVPAVSTLISFQNLTNNLTTRNANRLNAVATGTDITNSATRTAGWGTAAGIPTVTSTVTVSFANANAARYFFNAGGTIRISASRSGGSSTPQNAAWTQLASDIGTLALPAVNTAQSIAGTALQGLTKLGGGGSAPDIYSRLGFYNLTSTPALLYRQYSDQGVYTADNIAVRYSYDGGSTVTITVAFTDITSGGSDDAVDGSLTVAATARPPSTSYLTNTWGTPSVSVSAP